VTAGRGRNRSSASLVIRAGESSTLASGLNLGRVARRQPVFVRPGETRRFNRRRSPAGEIMSGVTATPDPLQAAAAPGKRRRNLIVVVPVAAIIIIAVVVVVLIFTRPLD
jgi:hypothetical protein